MKIPETSANVGAYYGNEENGQWQNGVIIDGGVGGGVVGSGDAGMHRPPVYPVHIPRGPMPAGYVMAGPYFPPYGAPPQDDFADYMWMENEEEFDKQVLQQLEEEALMEQCIEAMLEDEQRERSARGHTHHYPTTSNGAPSVSLQQAVSRSTLNPLAAEFVPTHIQTLHTEDKEKPESQEVTEEKESSRTEDEQSETSTEVETKTEVIETPTPPKDPPEVSAADVNAKPVKKESKKAETKKPVKTNDQKKTKVPAVKSETKVLPKKKEVKMVKSEAKIETKSEETVEVSKPQSQSPTPEDQSGPKPINYAAAARASKPKAKPTSPPTTQPTEKTTVKQEKPKVEVKPKVEKKVQPKDKPLPKEKVVQRKNSAK